jgi:phytol kinase
MVVAFTITVFVVLLIATELFQRRVHLAPEMSRRVVHIGSALVAALLAFVLTRGQIVAVALLFTLVMAASQRYHLLPSVHDVSRTTRGEIYFPLGLAGLALIAPDREAFLYGVLVLGLADGLAGLVGERYGGRTLSFSAGKSAVGSTTFFAVAAAVGLGVLLAGGTAALPALLVAAAAGLALTVVELFLDGGLDNLCIPVAAGLLLQFL